MESARQYSPKQRGSPSLKITDDTQAGLNVDATAGKSINAIRSFTGKGTLVWGARTLDGNSNEWRYIQVRRLFNYVEESIKKSTSWAVFEANDANTHIRVKAQIESFLTGIWKAGGLVGASAAQAFFVNVGLGSTVTPQDVLEGKMNVEIDWQLLDLQNSLFLNSLILYNSLKNFSNHKK